MAQRLVAVVGANNTQAEVTGQNELLVNVSSVTPGADLATESTLKSVLAAVDNMRDYEARLVEDSAVPNPVTWLEIRYWDAQSGALGTPEYYLPGSTTPGTPTLPISYINSQSLLTQIYAELQGQSTTLTTIESETANLDVPLSTIATEITLNSLLTAFNSEDFATETTVNQIRTTLNSLNAKFVNGNDIGDVTINNAAGAAAVNIQDGGNSITVDDGGSSITVDGTVNIGTIPEIEIKNDSGNPIPISDAGGSITVDGAVSVSGTVEITNDIGNPIPVNGTIAAAQSGTWNIASITGPVALPTGAATEATLGVLNSQFIAATRTPALIRTATSGTIPAGARSISVFNAGAAAGSILGVAGNILPGEVFEFSAGGENDTLAAFAYNGTGTTLVITSIV